MMQTLSENGYGPATPLRLTEYVLPFTGHTLLHANIILKNTEMGVAPPRPSG